jgi:hypothetical protein
MRLGVSQTFRQVQVRHREALADQMAVPLQMILQPGQGATQLFGGDGDGGLAFGRCRAAGIRDQHDFQRRGLDRRDRQQRPLVDQRRLLGGQRAQGATEAAGDMVGDGKAFGQDQPVLDIGRNLAQRVDRQERGRGRVQWRIRGIRPRQTMGLNHRYMGEGQLKLVQQPDRTRSPTAKDAVKGDHPCLLR